MRDMGFPNFAKRNNCFRHMRRTIVWCGFDACTGLLSAAISDELFIVKKRSVDSLSRFMCFVNTEKKRSGKL